MTKEAMIKVLRYKADHIKTKIKPEFFAEVADVLEKEPCEDAINREDAIMCMTGKYAADMTYKPEDIISKHIRRLRALPPVQPKIKTGHWIEYTRVLIPEPINKWEQAWYCSECGYGNQECEDGSARPEWKCCPRCEARMIDPQESENKK